MLERINLQKDGLQPSLIKSPKYVASSLSTSLREMNEMKYRVVIAWSVTDDAYVASVPDLPGCMAHGDTYEAALANVQDGAQLWLDTAREDGVPIPEPSDAQLASA